MSKTTKKINLALQGGGAHGAFTWGVLDRILEREDIEVAALSGTSAGALNATAFKSGLLSGGREGAKEALDKVWQQMGAISDLRINAWLTQFGPTTETVTRMVEWAMPLTMMDSLSSVMSPYAYGPFYQNPLKKVVKQLDCDALSSLEGPSLYISTTNVRNGKIRVFANEEVSHDVVMASACLPEMFQAIELFDPKTGRTDPYWDGGYTGNPALFPLFKSDYPRDIVVVNINPLEREGTPKSPEEIRNRVNEISFNSSLLRELRAIGFVRRLIADDKVADGAMKDVLIHMIADDEMMQDLSARTKLVPTPVLLARLKEAGRLACDRFLDAHFADIGVRASVDLEEMFG